MVRVRLFGKSDLFGKQHIDIKIRSMGLDELFKMIILRDGTTLSDYIFSISNANSLKIYVNGKRIPKENVPKFIVKNSDEVVLVSSSARGMVDITDKNIVYREAMAEGRILLKKSTIERIKRGEVEKGDVFETAKIAAMNAVKNTSNMIPYCHPLSITHIGFDHDIENDEIIVRVSVAALDRTGVEMEALTGVSTALLAIWDMVKKYEKDDSGNYPYTLIKGIRVLYKYKGM